MTGPGSYIKREELIMDANLDRAKVLTEALPYIQQYNGKIVVINCGGVPMTTRNCGRR